MDTEKFHTTTSKWSDNVENSLKDITESCVGYKWMNMFAARKNEQKFNILMYISIFIGPIAGILSTISTTEPIQALVTVFSFLSGVISSIIKFSDFGEKALLYKSISAKYASLESNIRRQLILTREDRVNAGEYLEWIVSSFDELFSSSPLISEDIYNEWVEFAKQNNLTIPKDIGKTTVVVNTTEHIENHSTYSDGKMRYEMARLSRMK